MDIGGIGNNLEALAEEDDEEEDLDERSRYIVGAEKSPVRSEADSNSENEEDEEEDDDVETREPNKFDGLCDGVYNSMALVHAALTEMLEMKDELLKHALPPTLLVKLALTTGKVFRSMNDMSHPVNELIRMVRVYSTPWEAKSAALKKLHEDYESKQRQLNIAIKRLQLVDAHSKRIAKEKRVMNWEKLFAKLTTARGHGRRWKFLIEAIKQKAKMGLEHVQEYTRALEEMSDSEEEVDKIKEPSEKTVEFGAAVETSEYGNEEEDDDDESGDEDYVDDEVSDKEVPTVMINITEDSDEMSQSDTRSRSSSPKRVKFEEPKVAPVIKPPTRDNAMWTDESEYDDYLHVRVFTPEDINKKDLKCTVTLGTQMFKTGILDAVDIEDEESAEAQQRPQAAGRDRNTTITGIVQDGGKKKARYEEFMIRLPDEIPLGVLDLSKPKIEYPKTLKIAVHYGKYEEIFAMASIEIEDLKELDLRIVYLPPPKGDDDVPKPPKDPFDLDDDFDTLSHSTDLSFNEGESDSNSKPKDDPVKDVDPLPFPLYSLHSGRADSHQLPCGNLPLVMYWGRKRRPYFFNRQCGTYGVNELVFELTGIDLNTTTKEDLHKELRDGATSAMEFTPEPQEETISKDEYNELISAHHEDMQILQETYDNQLKELLMQLQQMELERQEFLIQQQQQLLRPHSVGSHTTTATPSLRRSPTSPTSPTKIFTESKTKDKDSMAVPFTPSKALGNGMRPMPPKVQKHRKNFRIGRPLPKWGESLPEDFLERLRLFQEESKQHMAELNEKTLRDIRDSIEKKLAGQHKLSKHEEQMYDALKDVSLPALFMPFKTGTIFNPRAHQYFHPTGSTDLRLTQPPSMFQLPPLPKNKKLSVVNLFELSSNFSTRNTSWLMERYIHQQQPIPDSFGRISQGLPGQSIQPATNYRTEESSRSASAIDRPHSYSDQNLPEQEVEC